jgi:hypothetical protein
MPITEVLQDPDTEAWHFKVLHEDGQVEYSHPYAQRYGAAKGSRIYELTGAMPTKSRPQYAGQNTEAAASTLRRLTEDQVRDIRHSTEPAAVLMERYGIAKSTVSMVRTRRNYAWVQD